MGVWHPTNQRDTRGQRDVAGGRRRTDPPLTTRDCADWMGVTTDFVMAAIHDGQLTAERVQAPGKRPFYRIHLDEFITYLKSIGWSRLPKACADGAVAAADAD